MKKMRREEKIVVLLVVLCFLTLSFTSLATSFLMINHPPYSPTNFRPEPSDPFEPSKPVPIDSNFSWDGGDPDEGDTVTYDIYLGKTNPPTSLVDTVGPYPWNQTHIFWNPDFLLDNGTIYHCIIVARDNHNASNTSGIYRFVTVAESPLLNVGKVRGGFMQVTAEIQNINSGAGLEAINVAWKITVKGQGLLREINSSTNGTISLLGNNGGTERVNISDIWGLAKVTITIQATIPDDPRVTPMEKSTEGFIFGPFVYVKDSN